MKILILGGTGFIGSRLFSFLKNNKLKVDTLDLEIYGNFINKDNIKLDVRTFDLKILKNYDCIINLSGNSSVKSCECSIQEVITNNIDPLVRIMPHVKDKLFINASSSSVYGSSFKGIAKEEALLSNPINYYDFYKKTNDEILLMSELKNFYSLRFGTVCGASENLRNDIMINAMYESYLQNKNIKVFGGLTKRPILFILDLCNFILEIIKNHHHTKCGIYNLGSFNSTSYEIALETSKKLKCDLINLDKPNLGNVKMGTSKYDFWIDNQKSIDNFNYHPRGTVESILEDLQTYKSFNRQNRNKTLGGICDF